MSEDVLKRREELVTKRDELRDRLDRIKLDYRRGLDKNLEEQSLELENREVLEEIARVTSEELSRIEQAIRRIEQVLER